MIHFSIKFKVDWILKEKFSGHASSEEQGKVSYCNLIYWYPETALLLYIISVLFVLLLVPMLKLSLSILLNFHNLAALDVAILHNYAEDDFLDWHWRCCSSLIFLHSAPAIPIMFHSCLLMPPLLFDRTVVGSLALLRLSSWLVEALLLTAASVRQVPSSNTGRRDEVGSVDSSQ